MPTYNRADLALSAIHSALKQTFTSWELIVVDDGSTDTTAEVIDPILRSNRGQIKYIKQNNGGCASARNVGIKAATGKYLCLLDSDDLFMPAKLEIQVNMLEHNPSTGFVYSDAFEFDALTGKVWLSRVANHGGQGNFALQHFMTNHARSGALLYRKSVLDQVGGFREDFRYNEDSHFLQEIALRATGCYSEYPSYLVRNHSESKSRQLTNLVKHEQRSIELICHEFPDFWQANMDCVQARTVELTTKLFIANLISHNLSAAYTIFTQAKIGGLINGTARLITRRIKKMRNHIADREVIRRHSEEIHEAIKAESSSATTFR